MAQPILCVSGLPDEDARQVATRPRGAEQRPMPR